MSCHSRSCFVLLSGCWDCSNAGPGSNWLHEMLENCGPENYWERTECKCWLGHLYICVYIFVILLHIGTGFLQVSAIVSYVSFNGRFDHIMGNLHTLYVAAKLTQVPVYLLHEDSLACLLSPVSVSHLQQHVSVANGFCRWPPLGGVRKHWKLSDLRAGTLNILESDAPKLLGQEHNSRRLGSGGKLVRTHSCWLSLWSCDHVRVEVESQ